MREFGSDFHTINNYQSQGAHLTNVFPGAYYLADGRQCVLALLQQYGWKRIWFPEYFCYEVIETIRRQSGVKIAYYKDYPGNEENVSSLPFMEGDVLFRVNYFGLREERKEKGVSVPVIEDHTHDLLGRWALYSDADWCVASLRKTIPVPEGGMMWSPMGHELTIDLIDTEENEKVAKERWRAMDMKSAYLAEKNVQKDTFRKLYVSTEEWFDTALLSLIDRRSMTFIEELDINSWYGAKKRNWKLLRSLVMVNVMEPEDISCNPFSFTLLAKNESQRNAWRESMIGRCVYPAILWNVPDAADETAIDISSRMLSVHCDGRYNEDDIRYLAVILNEINQL